MKIRSLLLGSVAAAGFATAGYAADAAGPGVITALDVCSDLGVTGLTVSSETNCLAISGEVKFEYVIGDFSPAQNVVQFDRNGKFFDVADNDGVVDSKVDIDTVLKFVASAPTDAGKASATIELKVEDYAGVGAFAYAIDKAFVSVGDTTVLSAGKKGSIFKDKEDEPLNVLGLFGSENVDTGVGFKGGAKTGGVGISLESTLGDGFKVGAALENLQTSGPAVYTAVGTVAYDGSGVKTHLSGAVDQLGAWKAHAGFTGAFDPVTLVLAGAADSTGWWNVLGSAQATFDIFTLAISGEATQGNEWGVGASATAEVWEGVKLHLAGRYFDDTNDADEAWQVEGGLAAEVAEHITLTAAVGAIDGNLVVPTVYYGKAGLAWTPGGDFKSSIEGEVNSIGGYKATFKASKAFK